MEGGGRGVSAHSYDFDGRVRPVVACAAAACRASVWGSWKPDHAVSLVTVSGGGLQPRQC